MLAASFYKKYTSLSKPNIQYYNIDSLNFFKSGFWQKQRFTTYLLVFVRSIHQFNFTNDTSIQRHGASDGRRNNECLSGDAASEFKLTFLLYSLLQSLDSKTSSLLL